MGLLLYDYAGAPSPRRVRIFLAEKNLSVDSVQVDLASGEQFGAAYREINPDCVVPALRLDDGTVIGESVAICRYFEALHPQPALFGGTPLAQARIEMWQRRIETDGLLHARDAFRNRVAGMAGRALTGQPDGIEQIPALAERAAVMLAKFFVRLDRQLEQHDWIAGDAYSIADISALVLTDFASRLKLAPATTLRALADWHARASARPSAAA